MAVPITTDGGFAAGVPVRLFSTRLSVSNASSEYQPAADGQRFLVDSYGSVGAIAPMTIVQNWDAELKKR